MSKAYDKVTESILELLEEGTIPWRRPWTTHHPRNLRGREYHGLNILTLMSQGFASPFWVTYKQAKKAGGNVKKGEKGTPVFFWKLWKKKVEDEDGNESTKVIPLLRYYTVFNAEQTEGIEFPELGEERVVEPLKEAESIVEGFVDRPSFTTSNRAYYQPKTDTVGMPPIEDFVDAEGYYATLFHELGHSTGHESRLNRPEINGSFNIEDYSMEELVAELTSAFLCGEAGIAPSEPENAAAYIKGWLRTLRNDTKLVVYAAARAKKAADYVLGRYQEQQEQQEQRKAA